MQNRFITDQASAQWIEQFDAALRDDSAVKSIAAEKLVRFSAPEDGIDEQPSRKQYSFTITGMSQDVLIELMRFGILRSSASFGYEVHVSNGKTVRLRTRWFNILCPDLPAIVSKSANSGCPLTNSQLRLIRKNL
jgi:hypothetical protein